MTVTGSDSPSDAPPASTPGSDPDGRLDGVRASHGLALGAALATVFVARSSPGGLAVGVAGCLLLVAGLARRSRGAVVLSGVALLVATIAVAAGHGGLLATLAGASGAILAADYGTFALGLARDVDPSVATTRVELLHAVGSLAVAVLVTGVGYALFRSVPRGSTLGVVALLFAAVVLAAFLRP